MPDFQQNKALVLDYYRELDAASGDGITDVLRRYTPNDWHWRGIHPFYEQHGAEAVAEAVWKPFRQSFTPIQRRPDVFMAGQADSTVEKGIPGSEWVCSMGHLMGLFDEDWLGIPSNGKMGFLRYVEFNRLDGGKIVETALFCDIISVMQQVGLNPLPLQTGASLITPGPRTHDGLMYEAQEPAEGEKTLALINQMIKDLTSSYMESPEKQLAPTWHNDMIWFGPAGAARGAPDAALLRDDVVGRGHAGRAGDARSAVHPDRPGGRTRHHDFAHRARDAPARRIDEPAVGPRQRGDRRPWPCSRCGGIRRTCEPGSEPVARHRVHF